jgi:hypothetical protein
MAPGSQTPSVDVMPVALAFVIGLVPIASLATSLVWMARGGELGFAE